MLSFYSRNSLMPGQGRKPFPQTRGRSSNAAASAPVVRRSRSMAPQTSQRRRKSGMGTSTVARSRSVPRVTALQAPPPAVQFNKESSEQVEMSQLSTDECITGSSSNASNASRGNAPGITLKQDSLSVSTSSSKSSGGANPRLNNARRIQRSIKNEGLLWKPKPFRHHKQAQVTPPPPKTQRHDGIIAMQAYSKNGASQVLLAHGSQHSTSSEPSMNHHGRGGHGLSQASFGGSTVSRRLSQYSHSGPPSEMSQGSRRGLGQNSHPTVPSSTSQYQGSGQSLSQASASTRSTAPSTTAGSIQAEKMADDVFLRAQAKLERFFQDKMKETQIVNDEGQRMLQEIENHKLQTLQDIEDGKMKSLREIDSKMKKFDGQQHAFHNRIASAEEEHIERLEQFETKIAAATAQADSFDVMVADAYDQHQARSKELDAKVSKLNKMYSKASRLIKKAEQVAESSIISINQARSNLIDAALPILNEHVKGMMVGLPFSPSPTAAETSNSVSTPPKAGVSLSSENEYSHRKNTSKKRASPDSTDQGRQEHKMPSKKMPRKNSQVHASDSTRTQNPKKSNTVSSTKTKKNKEKTAALSAKKAPKRKSRSEVKTPTLKTQHSRKKAAVRSPMVPPKFVDTVPSSNTKTIKRQMTQVALSSPAQTVKSCVTPCDKENAELSFSVHTPDDKKSKPRKQPAKVKRRRGTFGSTHGARLQGGDYDFDFK